MKNKLKVAVITTVYFPLSHTDVIVTRWLEPLPSDAHFGWTASRSEIASMYVAQFPEGAANTPSPDERPFNPRVDMERQMAARHDMPLFPTVREALTLGGNERAVDAVTTAVFRFTKTTNRF